MFIFFVLFDYDTVRDNDTTVARRTTERERERETKKTHENYCTFNFIFEKLNFVIFRSVDLRFEKVAFASAGLE